MRIANAGESDWSEDTATLIYDSPAREAARPTLFATTQAAEGPNVRARAPIFSLAWIVVVVTSALIGAMAGAWTMTERNPAAAPIAESRAAEGAKPAFVERAAHVAAATALPPASAKLEQLPASPPAKAASEAMNPAVGAAAEPPTTPAPAIAPVEQAARPELQPQPVKAGITAAEPRRKHRTAARSRSGSSGAARSRSVAVRLEPAPRETPSAEQPAPARMGRLRINSRPWSKIFIDGKPAGNTPQAALEIAPGRHLVALISDEFDLKRTLTIEVRPGETVTRSVELLQ